MKYLLESNNPISRIQIRIKRELRSWLKGMAMIVLLMGPLHAFWYAESFWPYFAIGHGIMFGILIGIHVADVAIDAIFIIDECRQEGGIPCCLEEGT